MLDLGVEDESAEVGHSRSLARETQTQEDNFYQSEYLSFFDNNRGKIKITIPNMTNVKEGYQHSHHHL